MWTKAEVIDFAFRKSGIASGPINTNPTADMLADALTDYEALVDEYSKQMNIRPYKTTPTDINDYTGLSDLASQAMGYQLALRILPDYMMEPTPRLEADASRTLENLRVSVVNVPNMERRNNMPVGAGWKTRFGQSEFYTQANIVAGSKILAVDDVGTFEFNFGQGQLLPNEAVVSFQSRLSEYGELLSSAFSGNTITYSIKFNRAGAGWVAFTAAGDQDTVTTARIDFDVRSID